MNLVDKFTFWLMSKRADSLAKQMAEAAPERTMVLGMKLVEAVMQSNPDAGVSAIRKGGDHWGVMGGEKEHLHTAGCSGEQIH